MTTTLGSFNWVPSAVTVEPPSINANYLPHSNMVVPLLNSKWKYFPSISGSRPTVTGSWAISSHLGKPYPDPQPFIQSSHLTRISQASLPISTTIYSCRETKLQTPAKLRTWLQSISFIIFSAVHPSSWSSLLLVLSLTRYPFLNIQYNQKTLLIALCRFYSPNLFVRAYVIWQ